MEITTTIFFRWLSPSELYHEYMEGKFKTAAISGPKTCVDVKELTRERYEEGMEKDRCNYPTRDGTDLIMITTNCHLFNQHSKPTLPDIPLRCRFCTSDIPDGVIPTLLPLTERKEFLSDPQNPQLKHKVIIYGGNTVHCDLNCAMGTCQTNRNIDSQVSIRLRNIHRRLYPNSGPLRAADDPSLLLISGGTLSYKEYKKDRNEIYRKTIGVIVNPVKDCYIRI